MRTLTLAVVSVYTYFPLLALAQHEGHDHGQPPAAAAPSPRPAGQDHKLHDHTPAQAPKQLVGVPKAAGKQTTCPVSGNVIDPKASTMYEDQKVYFCSDDCIGKFNKSPEKHLPALYRQFYPQRRQVTCPVMGGEIDLNVSVEQDGQRIYFCCDGCDDKFSKDPGRYEIKLKDAFTQQVHCPLDGKAIDPTISLESERNTTYFCSERCREKFKTDGTLAWTALPAIGTLASGPTGDRDIVACAVTGQIGKRGRMRALIYQDKIYAVHSAACVDRFKASPAVYARRAANAAGPGRPPQSMLELEQPPATKTTTARPESQTTGHAAHGAGPATSVGGCCARPSSAGHGSHGSTSQGDRSPGCSH